MQITFDQSDLFIAWLNGLDEWSASDAILIHVFSDMNIMMIHDCHYLWGKAVMLSSQCFLSYIFWRIVPRTVFSYFFEFPMSSNVKFFPCGLVSSSEKSLMIMFERTEIWMVPVVVAWIIYYRAPVAPHVKNYCGWIWRLFQLVEAADWFAN